jgi:hypothetical protein
MALNGHNPIQLASIELPNIIAECQITESQIFQTSNLQTSKLTKRLHSEASFSDSDTKLAKPKVPSLTKLFYSIKDTVCSLWFHHGPFCSGMDPTCRSLCMVPHWSAKVPSLSTLILLVFYQGSDVILSGFYFVILSHFLDGTHDAYI